MPQPQYHFFVCANQRPPGHPKGSCGEKNAFGVLDRFMMLLEQKQLWGKMKITATGCMGPCMGGPAVVCYPEGVWYQGVTEQDVDEIVEKHVIGGEPVERLKMDPEFIM